MSFFPLLCRTEDQSASSCLSPASYERPKWMSRSRRTWTYFYVSNNTRHQFAFDHQLEACAYMTHSACVCLPSTAGRNGNRKRTSARKQETGSEETHWRRSLHHHDGSHEFFCVIFKETGLGWCQSVSRKDGKNTSWWDGSGWKLCEKCVSNHFSKSVYIYIY